MPTVVLGGTGLAIALPSTPDAMTNSGPHGLSEVLYAYASAGNNNGSAFAGLTVTSGFFQTTLGIAMLLGRFLPIVAVLALAGLLARPPRREPGPGTLSTGTPLFSVLVAGTIVLVAAITFLPALALSPLAEGLA
jgi:potassium-transporting ATPase potassium-binding subunit